MSCKHRMGAGLGSHLWAAPPRREAADAASWPGSAVLCPSASPCQASHRTRSGISHHIRFGLAPRRLTQARAHLVRRLRGRPCVVRAFCSVAHCCCACWASSAGVWRRDARSSVWTPVRRLRRTAACHFLSFNSEREAGSRVIEGGAAKRCRRRRAAERPVPLGASGRAGAVQLAATNCTAKQTLPSPGLVRRTHRTRTCSASACSSARRSCWQPCPRSLLVRDVAGVGNHTYRPCIPSYLPTDGHQPALTHSPSLLPAATHSGNCKRRVRHCTACRVVDPKRCRECKPGRWVEWVVDEGARRAGGAVAQGIDPLWPLALALSYRWRVGWSGMGRGALGTALFVSRLAVHASAGRPCAARRPHSPPRPPPPRRATTPRHAQATTSPGTTLAPTAASLAISTSAPTAPRPTPTPM